MRDNILFFKISFNGKKVEARELSERRTESAGVIDSARRSVRESLTLHYVKKPKSKCSTKKAFKSPHKTFNYK